MADKKIKLTKRDRFNVMWHSQFLQGSWNYERMQNGGYAYSMIPALRKLYPDKKDLSAALQRHLVFFNTHPYLASPVLGVTLALEEDKANGAPVTDDAIQGVKVGMMGPLAGVGYKAGSAITSDMSGGMLQKVTRGASMMGMFVLGALIERWVNIKFTPIVSQTPIQKGGYIEWDKLPSGAKGIQEALTQWNMGNGKALSSTKVTTLQDNLDSLIPGLAGLLLTFFCMWLLKKKVSPIWIIIGIFVVGVLFHVWGIL